MNLGFNTLGNLGPSRISGRTPSPPEQLASILEQGLLTERLGLSAFSVGEHHGDPRFVTSAPPVLLAAIAAQTEKIRLMTGVTLVSLLDPVRVAEDYATLDHVSGGRVDIVAGKGNFPKAAELLIGVAQPDRAALMEENIALLLEILDGDGHIESWSGTSRTDLRDAYVVPRPVGETIPIFLGATRNLDSVELAARHGLPVLLAGFRPGSYGDFADEYRRRLAVHGHDPSVGRVASLSVVAVDHDERRVRRQFAEHLEHTKRLAAELNPGSTRVAGQSLDELMGPRGQMLVGTPEYVAERIVAEHRALGQDLHLIQVDHGLAPEETIEAMHLVAEEVVPLVLRETASAALVS